MRKNLWLAVLAVMVLVILGAWGRGQAMERQVLENHLLAQYQRSFSDLSTGVQNIEVLLSKTAVANGSLDSKLLSKLSMEARASQSNLTSLPVQDVVVERTAKFLTQTGDYAAVMAVRKDDTKITDEDRETLAKLQLQARDLNKELHTIENRISDGSIYLAEMIKESREGFKRQQQPSPVPGNGFGEVNEIMSDYPTLIYDGPFSDHIEQRQPINLPGKNIEPDEARKVALAFIEKERDEKYQCGPINNIKGRIPAYGVEITTGQGQEKQSDAKEKQPDTIVAVSKKGGHPIWMITTHTTPGNSEGELSLQGTRDKAKKFLAGRDFGQMEAVGHQISGNLITHVFVPQQENILIYSEPIKVTVARDNGRITAFEASEYIMMNHDRKLPKPRISLKEARDKLCAGSNIEEEKLVITTSDTMEEMLAYEFRVSKGDQVFLIYINADNGNEEKILRVIEGPQGIQTV
ncbi:MAG TPA: germination protein YpeB [Clostridia bacterium]|nr:germination protein YpeB [Clostridia bacterium]